MVLVTTDYSYTAILKEKQLDVLTVKRYGTYHGLHILSNVLYTLVAYGTPSPGVTVGINLWCRGTSSRHIQRKTVHVDGGRMLYIPFTDTLQ